MTKATEKQIRDHFKAEGYEVRISKDGRVTFREPGQAWMEGRFVEEYMIIAGKVVHA